MKLRTIGCILTLVGAACVPAGTSDPSAAKHDRATERSFDGMLDDYLRLNPKVARDAGLHDVGDGHVADYSNAGIERRIARLHQLRDEIPRAKGDRHDGAILGFAIDQELFRLEDLNLWQRSPNFYEELFSVDIYILRDYAPLSARMSALAAHVAAALTQTDHILKNLRGSLPEPFIRTDIGIFKGFAEYLRNDIAKLVERSDDSKLRATTIPLVRELALRAEQIASHLERIELPRADQSYPLGIERFRKLVRVQEGLDTPLEELERMAEDDLANNLHAYQALRKATKPTRPKASQLLEEARRATEEARSFVEKKHLVTIPPDGHVEVREAPAFMRWNAAFLDGPGPLERAGLASFYYIALPDPAWPKAEQDGYVMTLGSLLATSVHEVYPGHFLQGLWARRAPSRIQKIFGAYSFIEGWAHYAEQMMIEEGFRADDPAARLGQLEDALLRNCRFVAAIGIHTKGMTVAQAQERFKNECAQDEASARQQAMRGTFDPGYFAYTLGKLQILALRKEAIFKLKGTFDLHKFHDALLSHGAPPVALIRGRVLEEIGANAKPPKR